MMTQFFFDSHGGLHVTCDPAVPGGAASLKARPEQGGLALLEGETPWAAARRVGRLMLSEDGGWYYLS